MSKILGIDLGTTNSAMAVLEGGTPTTIVNAEGDRTTPSVVGFRADGDRVVGKAAKNQAVTNPKNTVFSIKRFMGRKYSECTSEIKTVPYEVKEGQGGRAVVNIEGKDYTAEQVSAMVLAKMKADAEKYLSSTEHCVVTGNPLRSNIKIEERSAARKRLGLPDQFTILSFGGSLGANRITEAVAELIAWEEKTGGINHIHSYGGKGKELFYSALEQSGAHEDKSKHIFRDYIDNMYTCMCAADLIISRAGAMTITELMAIGRPAVLVPYPNAAENHQYYNALTLSNAHAAILIEDKDLTKARLVEEVSALYNDRGRLALMEENSRRSAKNDAADRILGEIIDLLGKEKFENQGSTD